MFGIAAILFILHKERVSADGLITGNLIKISPLFRARVEQIAVTCNPIPSGNIFVNMGQSLATISNELLLGQYNLEYQTANTGLQLSEMHLETSLAIAKQQVLAAKYHYEAARVAVNGKRVVWQAYDQLFRTTTNSPINRIAWETSRFQWEQAISEAAAAEAELYSQEATQDRIQREGIQEINALREKIAEIQRLQRTVGAAVLSAPSAGALVECLAQPGEVFEAGTLMFKIFRVSDAYAIAYIHTNDIGRLSIGMLAHITVEGIAGEITGHISAILPLATELPPPLFRYFWQRVQWSQYHPVQITFDNSASEIRNRLSYEGRIQVIIPTRAWWLQQLIEQF